MAAAGPFRARFTCAVSTCETAGVLETMQRYLGLDPSQDRLVLSKRLRLLNIVIFMVFLAGIVAADSIAVKAIVFVVFVATNVGVGLLAKRAAPTTYPNDQD